MKSILLLFFILLFTSLNAEKLSEEKLISNYIFNFAAYTSWPNSIKNEKFEIYILSSNQILLSTFKKLTKGQKIHGKFIKIEQGTKNNIPFTTNLVFVDTSHLKSYKKVYEYFDGRPVLIISKGYDNKRLVMINLSTTKKKLLHFEINKANILNQGLKINPKIILLGGTELDVAKLYKGAKYSLMQKEKELENQIKKAKSLDKEIKKSKAMNLSLQHEIQKKSNALKSTKFKILKLNKDKLRLQKDVSKVSKEVKNQKSILKQEKASTQKIRDDYAKANTQLDTMSTMLFSQEKKVKEKETKLSTLTQKIQQKVQEFQSLQDNLASQDLQIQDQDQTISNQKNFLILSVSALILFFLLLIFIYLTLSKVKNINKKLNLTQEQLELQVDKTNKANASKTKFLAHMSHELRTPLNAVLGYSQLLQKDPSMSERNQVTLSTINRSGEHLLALINDVLEVSKIETGEIQLEPIAFDLHEFLDDINAMFAPRLKHDGLSLVLSKDKDLARYIKADINKIRQIFLNILGNSTKFTHQGGIKIIVKTLNNLLQIEIEDTGDGIAEEELDKLFKPFMQTISGKLGGGGAGLGLSIVQEYIDIMKGKIQVKSKLGYGTVFFISIPYEKSEFSEFNQSKPKEVLSLKEKYKGIEVLIADDNKVNNELLQEVLERVGFSVKAVENGFEALRLFKQIRPEILLLDLDMPIMNGYKAIKEIRSLDYGKNIPAIAVTASVFGMNNEEAKKSGFSSYVRKPFKDYEIYTEIEKFIELEYDYEEASDNKEVTKLQVTSLQDLSPELKEAIESACTKMSISKINDIIELSKDRYPKESQYIKALAQNFDFKKIITSLKEN
ncbi:DUF4154 domain-containing protein [Sulfurimonas sp. MAG313]|nr:YfiR/HmsC family protein [Sulfurimonas sp. MAG313]MDF1881205.1 DUF4154 domain-containing protein [Sulfurimonas sp. MAG313]